MKKFLELMALLFILAVIVTVVLKLTQESAKDAYFEKGSTCKRSGDVIVTFTENGQQNAKSKLEADGVVNDFNYYSFRGACERK